MSPTTVADPTARLPARELALLSTTLFAAVTTELLPVGLLPQLTAAFDVSPARIGWWTSAYALVVAAGAVPVTALVTQWPPRRSLLGLLGCYVLSNLLVVVAGSVPSYGLALAARLLGGAAHAAFFSVVIATAVRISPPGRRGSAVTTVTTGVLAAFAFGVPLASTAGAHLGWRSAFVGTAVLLLGLLLTTAVVLPPDATATRAPTGPVGDVPPPGRRTGGTRGLVVVGTFSMLFLLGHTVAYTYVTELLRRNGVAGDLVGPLLFAFGLGALVGVGVVSRVADAHPTAALRTCGALMAGCLAVLALPPVGVVAAAAVLVAWGAAYGGLPAMMQTAGLRVATNPATAPAVVNATTNAGIATGAWLGGLVLTGGVGVVAATASVVVVAATALTLLPSTPQE